MAETTEQAVSASRERVEGLRRRVITEINEVFADLLEATSEDGYSGTLMRIATRFEQERNEALARVAQLESELRSRPRLTTKQEHVAIFQDAAITLRNAMAGLTNAPVGDVASARFVGQVNKAVVEFDNVTKGMVQ